MHEAVQEAVAGADIFIGAAAVVDYGPAAVAEHKIKSVSQERTFSSGPVFLDRTFDIISLRFSAE